LNLVNKFTEAHGHEDHGHEEHGHESHAEHDLFEVMFGLEHVVAEFFWNAVFILIGFAVSKAVALRKIHKYIDDKHGVSHSKKEY
jgi:hypothetical protein